MLKLDKGIVKYNHQLIFRHSDDAEPAYRRQADKYRFSKYFADEITIEFIQKYEKIDYIICRRHLPAGRQGC